MGRRRAASDPTPEEALETGAATTAVENEDAGGAGDVDETSGVSETEELSALSREDQQAAIASAVGGPDQYPYVDRTAIPVHERDMLMNSGTEASQAELNPAFTPQAKDGGPVTENDESVGTEPNAYEQQAAAAENQGGEELRKQVEEDQAKGAEQQIDAEQVTADQQAREADAKDGEPTPAGAPSGMEPSSDGEAGTAGASE